MFEFRLQTIEMAPAYYLLLPKLNHAQVHVVAKRLGEKGYEVEGAATLLARGGDTSVRLNPTGICWSSSDPTDVIAPMIPEILDLGKEEISVGSLSNRYFQISRPGAFTLVRMATRLESSPLWRRLRAKNLCALTPDEREVVAFLVGRSEGASFLTDFPNESSQVRMLGKRLYYETSLDASEAKSLLSAAGQTIQKHAYLLDGGFLQLSGFEAPSNTELSELFQSLGQWCYFRPVWRKRSKWPTRKGCSAPVV